MARRSEHSLDELRVMVLDAAETLVINEGFPALTARRIAVEIGYTVGSIYRVYANMADLILHINARTLDEIAARLGQVREQDATQAIEALALAYLHYAGQNADRWRGIFAHCLSADTAIPNGYREKLDRLRAPLEARFAQLAPGLADEQRRLAARALWSGVHGICMLSPPGEADIHDTEETVVLLVRNFMRGWLASLPG
jgi:AcrR family transcriptional regulator